LLDAFDLDAGQVREEGIETLLITCPASSPTPDPVMEPFPSRNVGQIPVLTDIARVEQLGQGRPA
jgi:hypothetical protein